MKISSSIPITLSIALGSCTSFPVNQTNHRVDIYREKIIQACNMQSIEPFSSQELYDVYFEGVNYILKNLYQDSGEYNNLVFDLMRGSKVFFLVNSPDKNASICVSPSGSIAIFFHKPLWEIMKKNQNIFAFVVFHEISHRVVGADQNKADTLAFQIMQANGYNSVDPELLQFIKIYAHR